MNILIVLTFIIFIHHLLHSQSYRYIKMFDFWINLDKINHNITCKYQANISEE